jgi:hypothetical protein
MLQASFADVARDGHASNATHDDGGMRLHRRMAIAATMRIHRARRVPVKAGSRTWR